MCNLKPLTPLLKILILCPLIVVGAGLVHAAAVSAALQVAQQAAPFTQKVERCIVPAARYHHVNPYILRAILRVESRLKPDTVVRNANGSYDIGMGGYNSVNFREIAKHGIAPQHLLDACVATYVSAWHLKKNIIKYGLTWFGVAAYHSATPCHNHRYQVLLYNELVKSDAMQVALLPVPSLRSC